MELLAFRIFRLSVKIDLQTPSDPKSDFFDNFFYFLQDQIESCNEWLNWVLHLPYYLLWGVAHASPCDETLVRSELATRIVQAAKLEYNEFRIFGMFRYFLVCFSILRWINGLEWLIHCLKTVINIILNYLIVFCKYWHFPSIHCINCKRFAQSARPGSEKALLL